jgi:hypothetical protein
MGKSWPAVPTGPNVYRRELIRWYQASARPEAMADAI